jgi:hypothetical protein
VAGLVVEQVLVNRIQQLELLVMVIHHLFLHHKEILVVLHFVQIQVHTMVAEVVVLVQLVKAQHHLLLALQLVETELLLQSLAHQ